jgi:hypothetical protein
MGLKGSTQQADADRPRPQAEVAQEPAAGVPQLAGRPRIGVLSSGRASIQAQAALLSDPRLQLDQRRSLAAEIGTLHGNRYLQRVVAALHATRAAAPIQAAGGSTGQRVAEAARSFPSGIKFGSMMADDGILFNLTYWVVEYALKKGDKREKFGFWREAEAFLKDHPDWKVGRGGTTYVSIHIAIKPTARPSAAIEDVWNPDSAHNYQFDCFIAAALMELHGIYREHLAKGWTKADFDRRQRGFEFDLTSKASETSLSATGLASLTATEVPKTEFTLAEFDANPASFKLKPGDWVYIDNPYLTGSWAGENAIYVGGKEFSGHPIGTFTPTSYADYLIDKKHLWRAANPDPKKRAPRVGTREELRSFILSKSKVGPRARPGEIPRPRSRRGPRRR